MTIREVFKNKGAYLLIISFGFLQFIIVCIMAFYVTRLSMTGTDPGTYLLWLSIAAILGMPISYLLGMVDDKFGTVAASLILCITYIIALVCLLFMQANNILLISLTAIGIAGITGGTPNLLPSMTAYVYGRKNYQAANRWIMAIQSIIMAFAIYFMSAILEMTGTLDLAYIIMIVMVIIAVVCLILLGRTPDFDRGKEKIPHSV
jgi:MFS family permease